MRSRREYIITKEEVHGYANHWLDKSLKLEYEGTKYTANTLLQILLIAAARPTFTPTPRRPWSTRGIAIPWRYSTSSTARR